MTCHWLYPKTALLNGGVCRLRQCQEGRRADAERERATLECPWFVSLPSSYQLLTCKTVVGTGLTAELVSPGKFNCESMRTRHLRALLAQEVSILFNQISRTPGDVQESGCCLPRAVVVCFGLSPVATAWKHFANFAVPIACSFGAASRARWKSLCFTWDEPTPPQWSPHAPFDFAEAPDTPLMRFGLGLASLSMQD